jgi:hypothetical protein
MRLPFTATVASIGSRAALENTPATFIIRCDRTARNGALFLVAEIGECIGATANPIIPDIVIKRLNMRVSLKDLS